MTSPRDNLPPDPNHAPTEAQADASPATSPASSPDSLLDLIDSSRPAPAPLAAMQRDRAALRAALAADLERPLSPSHHAALRAARDAALRDAARDEIDTGVLAALTDGVALPPDPTRRVIRPVRPGVLATLAPWLLSRSAFATAAALTVLTGAFYLAFISPAGRAPAPRTIAQAPRDPALPSWAILPDRPAPIAPAPSAPTPGLEPEPVKIAAVTSTTDPALALTWLREGRLAVRLTTDAPRRDTARLDALLDTAKPGSIWALAAADGRDAVVPARPWPIDTRMADADERSALPRQGNARLRAYDLALRPTADAIAVAKESLERATRGRVVFERVDPLASDGIQLEDPVPSASGLLWWTKPAEQWSRRVRLPLVVEFGSPSSN